MALTSDEVPFACCRFEAEKDHVVVSVNFAPEYRSLGLGSRILEKATIRALELLGEYKLLAYIKTENIRSIRAFQRAGYAKVAISQNGREVLEWVPR